MKFTKPFDGPKPSRQFLNSLQGGGGTFIDCHCGREHYAINSEHLVSNWNDDDFDEERMRQDLIKRAETEEGLILHYDCDSVGYRIIEGNAFADDCPCNGLRKYENWIWTNRDMIKEYLIGMKAKIQSDIDSLGDLTKL